jgi:anti-anti-sigma factor
VTQFATVPDSDHRIEWGQESMLVSLQGPLVYEALEPLQSCWEVVRGQPRPTVFLDLSGVTYLASGALGSLVAIHRWLTVRGHRLCVSALSLPAREAMRLTGLTEFFAIHDSTSVSIA